VLNTAQKNYLRGARYTFSWRRGYTKIDSRDGRRLVHDEGNKPTLTANFTPEDLIYLRQQRQQCIQKSEAIVLHQEQQAKSGQKKS
jgi:hypothetical protein